MSPRYPGGPRPTLRMPNQVLTHPQPFILPFFYFRFLYFGCCFMYFFLFSASRWSPRVTATHDKQLWTPRDRKVTHCSLEFYNLLCLGKYAMEELQSLRRLLNDCASSPSLGHPNMGGPMRMNPPRGMGGMGPQVGWYCCQSNLDWEHCKGHNHRKSGNSDVNRIKMSLNEWKNTFNPYMHSYISMENMYRKCIYFIYLL